MVEEGAIIEKNSKITGKIANITPELADKSANIKYLRLGTTITLPIKVNI